MNCVQAGWGPLKASLWPLGDHRNPSLIISYRRELAERKSMALSLQWLQCPLSCVLCLQNGSWGEEPEELSLTPHTTPQHCLFYNRAGLCQILCQRPGPKLSRGFPVSMANSLLRPLAELHPGGGVVVRRLITAHCSAVECYLLT